MTFPKNLDNFSSQKSESASSPPSFPEVACNAHSVATVFSFSFYRVFKHVDKLTVKVGGRSRHCAMIEIESMEREIPVSGYLNGNRYAMRFIQDLLTA